MSPRLIVVVVFAAAAFYLWRCVHLVDDLQPEGVTHP
jgi:hypothetical protein